MDLYSFLKFIALANSLVLLFLIGVILVNLRLIKSGLVYLTHQLDILIDGLIAIGEDIDDEEEEDDIHKATLELLESLKIINEEKRKEEKE